MTRKRQPDPHADLFRAVLTLETLDDCRRFFKDITTPAELKALSERWHVARLLDEGELSYREIHDETGVSTTTITRVARFLGQEPNRGYRLILDRVKQSRVR
ncbi:MAG: YerC/YecD family TrpR-related protein [Acidobacteriota bacterium]|nr:MAG: YerC/YecD family TrpR-related protein [Acidobacteriota bacterium]